MKKLKNVIFGKESKYHDHNTGESIESEKHEHANYEGVTSRVAPISPDDHVRHHTHHAATIIGREDCIECSTFHSMEPCLYCKPNFFQASCPECAKEKAFEKQELAQQQQIAMERPSIDLSERPQLNTVSNTIEERTNRQSIERPAVIHEKLFPVEREEIQPIIRREREKTEILQVEQPMYESEIKPTVVHDIQLPTLVKPELVESRVEVQKIVEQFGNSYRSTKEIAPTEHRVIEKTPIIHEYVRKRIIEEVQPIIHKEVIEPHLIRGIKPIYEKIVEAPVITRIIKEMDFSTLQDKQQF